MVSIIRHMDVFDPTQFKYPVDVVGCGAVGSKIVLELAKLGVANIRIHDHDTIVPHNIPNQAFRECDVGKLKVNATNEIVEMYVGRNVDVSALRIPDPNIKLHRVVFTCVDSMEGRKEIWNTIRMKLSTDLYIEVRMGSDTMRIYTINPNSIREVEEYEKTLYDGGVVERGICGNSISMGPTSSLVASIAVWQLVRWYAIQTDSVDDILDGEIILFTRPMKLITRRF